MLFCKKLLGRGMGRDREKHTDKVKFAFLVETLGGTETPRQSPSEPLSR